MIRLGNVEDLADVMTMLEACIVELNSRNLYFWNDKYPNKHIILADLASGNAVVNEIDHKVVSFLVMCPNKTDKYEDFYHDHYNFCLVQRVMVHPDYRRQGLAQNMFSFVFNEGFQSIRLLTRDSNTYAGNLYKKIGFNIVKEELKDGNVMQALEKILRYQ